MATAKLQQNLHLVSQYLSIAGARLETDEAADEPLADRCQEWFLQPRSCTRPSSARGCLKTPPVDSSKRCPHLSIGA